MRPLVLTESVCGRECARAAVHESRRSVRLARTTARVLRLHALRTPRADTTRVARPRSRAFVMFCNYFSWMHSVLGHAVSYLLKSPTTQNKLLTIVLNEQKQRK
ncbi:hypothetical protein O3G_MSEX012320 [Manduca sexta]|uniref:Uncharacterized protein n=1 Tax=Manduca sexta TaxID=7130 RepID=A0A922CWY0_MANSE|nr:hypothetical protein O3G_MSEX012320 [Manduca sexta]